jgi:hypothetical protein
MVTALVALYLVHPNRSRKAFNELVRNWQGVLVSDNFSVYQNWINKRQNCLAHYIRKAKQLCESTHEQLSSFGRQPHDLLQQLCRFANAPPIARKWKNFYSRFLLLLMPDCVQQVLIRADAEFQSWESINECIKAGYHFIIANKRCDPPFDPQC